MTVHFSKPTAACALSGDAMYQACVPVFVRGLRVLAAELRRGTASAAARQFDPTVLVQARLAPDMAPLKAQVFIATDQAKGCAARLAGQEVPSYPDVETTLPELIARLRKTVEFISSVPAERFEGAEDRTISLKAGPRELTFSGRDYLFGFVIPNFYFHVTTAYAILRHNGLEIGKMDYIGRP